MERIDRLEQEQIQLSDSDSDEEDEEKKDENTESVANYDGGSAVANENQESEQQNDVQPSTDGATKVDADEEKDEKKSVCIFAF